MPAQFKLEHVIDSLTMSEETVARRRTLRQLTGLHLPVNEAQHAWERIMDHKWYLGERLGRDVGLRVAAVDYFDNIAPVQHIQRHRSGSSIPARLPMMQSLSR